MKKISLTNNKNLVLIDDEDYEKISQFKWYLHTGANKYPYAGTWRNGAVMLMHRFLMDAPKGMEVDHINGNGLDNRKFNMRICSHSENQKNKKIAKNNTSGYKGVRKHGNRWRAEIKYNNIYHNLGGYETPQIASSAYIKARDALGKGYSIITRGEV